MHYPNGLQASKEFSSLSTIDRFSPNGAGKTASFDLRDGARLNAEPPIGRFKFWVTIDD